MVVFVIWSAPQAGMHLFNGTLRQNRHVTGLLNGTFFSLALWAGLCLVIVIPSQNPFRRLLVHFVRTIRVGSNSSFVFVFVFFIRTVIGLLPSSHQPVSYPSFAFISFLIWDLRAHNGLCLRRFCLCQYRRTKCSGIVSANSTVLSSAEYPSQRTQYNVLSSSTIWWTIRSTTYLFAWRKFVPT